MATKRTYVCEVCGRECPSGDDKEMIGFDFQTVANSGIMSEAWKRRPNYECNNHLCMKCLGNAALLFESVSKEAR